MAWLRAGGHTCVLWNSVPGDWLDPDGWVETALAEVESQPTSVVVLHDILPDAMRHLDHFLSTLTDRGHTFTHHFPTACLPLVEGRPTQALTGCVGPPPDALSVGR